VKWESRAVLFYQLAGATSLAERTLRAKFMTKLAIAVVVLAVGGIGFGTGVPTNGTSANEADKPSWQERPYRVVSPCDGVVAVVGTEIRDGEIVSLDRVVTMNFGGAMFKYRRLKEGDTVDQGQLVVLLDHRQARNDLAIAKAKVLTLEAEYERARALQGVSQGELERLEKIRIVNLGAVPAAAYRAALARRDKYRKEAHGKRQALMMAIRQLEKAKTAPEMYKLRSKVRGVVETIYKHPGDPVKALEPIVLIRPTDARGR
jgi:multidrug efflux pump subunit AcrA (membrane-fusion protein)